MLKQGGTGHSTVRHPPHGGMLVFATFQSVVWLAHRLSGTTLIQFLMYACRLVLADRSTQWSNVLRATQETVDHEAAQHELLNDGMKRLRVCLNQEWDTRRHNLLMKVRALRQQLVPTARLWLRLNKCSESKPHKELRLAG